MILTIFFLMIFLIIWRFDALFIWQLYIIKYLFQSKLSSVIIHLYQRFFQSSKHVCNVLLVNRQQLLFWFFFYIINRSKTILLLFGQRKSQLGPSAVNTVVEAWLRFRFWPKAQASICELMRYHGGKSITCLSIILCLSNKLICSIGE